jgi:hypothetical protein
MSSPAVARARICRPLVMGWSGNLLKLRLLERRQMARIFSGLAMRAFSRRIIRLLVGQD